MTDPIDIDAIEERAHAASDGPWAWVGHDLEAPDGTAVICNSVDCMPYCYGGFPRVEMGPADSEFLEHARTDVPALVAELRRLHILLTHPRAHELLDNHRYLTSGEHAICSCRGDYGPGTETPTEWVAHLIETGRLQYGIEVRA